MYTGSAGVDHIPEQPHTYHPRLGVLLYNSRPRAADPTHEGYSLVAIAPPAAADHRDCALAWWWEAHVDADGWSSWSVAVDGGPDADGCSDRHAPACARDWKWYWLADGRSADEGGQTRDLFARRDEGRRQPLVLVREVFHLRLELCEPCLLSLTALERSCAGVSVNAPEARSGEAGLP